METNVSGFTFFSTFDSGNLASVEAIPEDLHPLNGLPDVSPDEMPVEKGGPLLPSDHSFRIWTRPDCSGTEFENGNRTWFYFGLRGGPSQHEELEDLNAGSGDLMIRLTVMNLNKQSKLFSQGMAPIVMVVPLPHTIYSFGKDKSALKQAYPHGWERIRDKPTYWTLNNENKNASNFVVSFRVKCNPKATTYIAFTYPYSYKDLQHYLNRLERKYANPELVSESPPSKIYFHRELAIRSLLNFRVDLLTISDSNGISEEREPLLENLFPDHPHTLRPRVFKNKKTVFVSARVHPGETQSSFVMIGFIKFLLRENDARAEALRRKYVFKLIPMLNPDGVVHGHYRTDTRGVNLNRVYGSPSLELHPTIYAAKKLILYAHHRKDISDDSEETCKNDEDNHSESTPTPDLPVIHFKAADEKKSSHWLRSSYSEQSLSLPPTKSSVWYEMTETSRFSEGDESIADFSVLNSSSEKPMLPPVVVSKTLTSFSGAFGSLPSTSISSSTSPRRRLFHEEPSILSESSASNGSSSKLGEVPKDEEANLDFPKDLPKHDSCDQEKSFPIAPSKHSGLFLYVDIHGHASKRGIFMYGNHFTEMDHQVGCMLLPKLMSINCAHFDFPACVFTQKNMYMKDRHTGAGKEGSGRVSAFKATGLLYSYTMECNFNTGRLVNGIPMASRDCGRATPPPKYDHPPKYDPDLYEDSGKAMAIAILDLTESNPWTRLTCSAHKNLRGVREWLKKYIKAKAEEELAKANSSPSKTNLASPATNRALRSSNARRVRTFSASSNPAKKKKGPKPPPSSPESYRPVNKIPRKNSIQQQPPMSPRGRKAMISASNVSRSASAGAGMKGRPGANSIARGRSQSVVLPRSRPTSPKAATAVKTPKKTKKKAATTSKASSLDNTTSEDQTYAPKPATNSSPVKKPLKRIRRPRKGSSVQDTDK